jgi:hypothetical protein
VRFDGDGDGDGYGYGYGYGLSIVPSLNGSKAGL